MSTLGAVLNTAMRSILANQYALAVSANNIANANNPDFSRQRLLMRPAIQDGLQPVLWLQEMTAGSPWRWAIFFMQRSSAGGPSRISTVQWFLQSVRISPLRSPVWTNRTRFWRNWRTADNPSRTLGQMSFSNPAQASGYVTELEGLRDQLSILDYLR